MPKTKREDLEIGSVGIDTCLPKFGSYQNRSQSSFSSIRWVVWLSKKSVDWWALLEACHRMLIYTRPICKENMIPNTRKLSMQYPPSSFSLRHTVAPTSRRRSTEFCEPHSFRRQNNSSPSSPKALLHCKSLMSNSAILLQSSILFHPMRLKWLLLGSTRTRSKTLEDNLWYALSWLLQMILERDSSVLGYPGEILKALDADHHDGSFRGCVAR